MEFTTFLFYAFSTLLIFAAGKVITDRNPVNAALFLILSLYFPIYNHIILHDYLYLELSILLNLLTL